MTGLGLAKTFDDICSCLDTMHERGYTQTDGQTQADS